MSEERSWMNQLPPKVMFFGGLIGGVLVLCTIGFFILLGMVVSGKAATGSDVAAVPSQPSQPADPSQPQQVGKPAAVANDEHILGNKNAKVTLVEYSDYQCPFCNRFHPVAEQLVNDSKGQVRLVYRNFPLTSIHPNAQRAAESAECVASLRGNDAYFKYGAALFANQENLGDSLYIAEAGKVGVNSKAMQDCLKSGKFTAKVNAQAAEGTNIGVQGTPATFVVAADGSVELIPGALSYEQAKEYVDRALQKNS